MLAAFLPRRDDEPGGEVRKSHATVCRVLVLPSLAPGAEGVDPALG
jgi:hypothetical protein